MSSFSDTARRVARTIVQAAIAGATAIPVIYAILAWVLDQFGAETWLADYVALLTSVVAGLGAVSALLNKIEDAWSAIDDYLPDWLRREIDTLTEATDETDEVA